MPTNAEWSRERVDTFFAVNPDLNAAARGARLAAKLCSAYRLVSRLRPANLLHATILPIGVLSAFPDPAIAAVKSVGALVEQPSFEVRFDRVISFKAKDRYPLVLLCGEGADELKSLRTSLEEAMRHVGFRGRATKAFTPHIPLAYTRRALPQITLDEPIAWTVRDFALVHSLIGHSDHERIGRWSLRT